VIDQETLKLLAKKITLAIVGRGDMIEVSKTTFNHEQDYVTHYEDDQLERLILEELQCLALKSHPQGERGE
jgi:hypothetical protein